jgi:hypothetical protein
LSKLEQPKNAEIRPAAFLDRDGTSNVDRGYTIGRRTICAPCAALETAQEHTTNEGTN